MNPAEGMVVLQERMVNLVNQLSMPVLECSLVIGRWTNKMTIHLTKLAQTNQETLTPLLSNPWDLDVEPVKTEVEFDLEKALSLVDHDRMDILDTLVRVTIEEQELPLADGLLVLRSWEKLVREQLSQVKGPGQLFSPTDIPEDF
ncbi:MAG TPA: hypothetical protein EYQ73_07950 [Candidatus Poseidoniales archaeon]|jgi:hypothetical protein|nr:MAG: hypothetical protein CXT71_02940 [Euryarchaeota archaeon]HIF46704.1 hypothetical protein [Candidatus Poseidoniales archaeon]HIL66143.1 hypothetical protein [Candidatus Poseidoniales archaeon]